MIEDALSRLGAGLDEDEALAKRQEPTWYYVEQDLGWEAGTDLMEYFQRFGPKRALAQAEVIRTIAAELNSLVLDESVDWYPRRVAERAIEALAGIYPEEPK